MGGGIHNEGRIKGMVLRKQRAFNKIVSGLQAKETAELCSLFVFPILPLFRKHPWLPGPLLQ